MGDIHLKTLALVEIGCCASLDGDYDQAEALFRIGVAHFTEMGDKNQLAAPVRRLGHIALVRQEYVQALQHLRHSLALNIEVGDRRGVAACLRGIACVYGEQGRLLNAAQLLGAEEQLLSAISVALMQADRSDFDCYAARIRLQYTDPALAAAHADGLQLSQDQAVLLANKV